MPRMPKPDTKGSMKDRIERAQEQQIKEEAKKYGLTEEQVRAARKREAQLMAEQLRKN